MRAPSFWRYRSSPLATLLRPAGAVYGLVSGWRMGQTGVRASVPVICVGNFVAGGAGKTPTALVVARLLRELGRRPVFLTRGYGGTLRRPTVVDLARHGAVETGDEPRLLAALAPTVIARDRVAGARLAEGLGDVIVMDDGLQNPSLTKDLCLAVVDAGYGVGNGLCIPAGPLRAPLSVQGRFVDAVVIVGDGEPPGIGEPDLTVMRARLRPDEAAASRLRGRPVVAFAGIGRPEKFFETLAGTGADIRATHRFPDHHPYRAATLARLREEAAGIGATLVTTEKDLARMQDRADAPADILSLPVAMVFDDEDALRALLATALVEA